MFCWSFPNLFLDNLGSQFEKFLALRSGNKQYLLHKKTFCWLLNNRRRLTNERLDRFKSSSLAFRQLYREAATEIQTLDSIMKLDFIIIKGRLAQVLGFRNKVRGRKTLKKLKINKSSVQLIRVEDEDEDDDDDDMRFPIKNIAELLVNFYYLKAEQDGTYMVLPSELPYNSLYTDIQYYETHVPRPTYSKTVPKYDNSFGKDILSKLDVNN